jgi:hypothetical protein
VPTLRLFTSYDCFFNRIAMLAEMLSKASTIEQRNGEEDEIFALDETTVCQRTAILILRRHPVCSGLPNTEWRHQCRD